MNKNTLAHIKYSKSLADYQRPIYTAISLILATQSVGAQSVQKTDKTEPLEIIMVTAQKRSESIQEVPIAMQAVYGDQLAKLGIQKASDITRISPNVNISGQNSANQQINIRGVGTSDFFGTATGAVGIYMDEVTMSAPYLSGIGLFDMERIEILRGPQNSLFGRNTTGGAVNYISNQPKLDGNTDGYASVNFGNFGLIDLEAAGTFKLSDKSALRLAGKSYNRDGIWHDLSNGGKEFGKKESQSFRATLVFEPSEKTKITGNLHIANEDSQMDPVRTVGTRIENGIPQNGPLPTSRFAAGEQIDFERFYANTFNNQGDNPSTDDWHDVYVNHSQPFEMENTGGYLKIVHDLDWAAFSSITSYDSTEVRWGYDVGGNNNAGNVSTLSMFINEQLGGPAPAPQAIQAINQDQEYEQWSQEFRLISGDDSSFKWIAGLYLFGEDSTLSQNVGFGISALPYGGPPAGGGLVILAFGGNPASNQTSFSVAEVENFVWSPYIHTEFELSDKLGLTFGLRYTNDEKKLPSLIVGNLDNTLRPHGFFWDRATTLGVSESYPLCDLDGDGNLFSGSTADNRGTLCRQDIGGSQEDLSFSEFGGKLGLDYKFSKDLFAYASVSRGFRSGKSDVEFIHGPHTGIPRQNVEVEILDALEAGFKSTVLDGTLQLNGAIFYYIWEDQQQFFVGPNGPDFVNIDESELKGLELEFRWALPADIKLQGGIGLQDTEITKSSDESAAQTGHELPFAADASANLMFTKTFVLDKGLIDMQIDYQYRSAPKAYAMERALVDELEPTRQLNARLVWTFGDFDEYEMTLYGNNINGDKRCTYKWELTAVGGVAYCIANEGEAMYGVIGKWSF